jgi:N-acetylneuraminic acid mutarotase
VKVKTDANGKATFTPDKSGLVAVLANTTDEDTKGTLNGKQYTSAMHYATLTFPWVAVEGSRESRVEGREPEVKAPATSSHLKPLPEAVSSFGAAVCDGWLYIYSGHTGTEHDHSAENLSQNFVRIKLDGTTDWESLPMQTPLQGLALVAHDGKLYRVGGMNARNATTKDDEDLRSTTEFAVFDPATKKWQDLAPLPAPRSSHNAAVIGDKLYVIGGWTLSGSRKGKWLTDSLVFDLKNPSAGWQPLPEQPFQRRALAAGEWKGKLVALGGMDEKQDVSQEVDLFDPQTGQWSQGPKLPGAGMAGFGVSAWNLDGDLYVSGFRGQVFRLTEDGSEWEEVARLVTPRFFHQLVPAGVDGALIAVGGASRDGHLVDLELIKIDAATAQDSQGGAASTQSTDAHRGEG